MSRQYSNSEQCNKLSNLIGYYEICNRSEGKSPKTVNWYSSNLKRFYHYLEDKHLSDSIDQIDIKVLWEYVLYLLKTNKLSGQRCNSIKAERLSPATVHGHVITLRAFFSWLEREEFTEKNLATKLSL
jgi:site-specific recombinase XerD